jgi:MFS family permease
MVTIAETKPAADETLDREKIQVAATAFLSLFAIVGIALYGLPFYYDYMVREFGWDRATVTSGNTFSKLIVGPAFGFIAGWMVDRFGPRRLMLVGILLAGTALIGLGNFTGALWMFYFFYLFNALGYVFAGPLPNQVLLTRWFDKSRGKAMGFAYLGIGIAGGIVPLLSAWLAGRYNWHTALTILGVLMIVIAFPMAFFVKDSPGTAAETIKEKRASTPIGWAFKSRAFYLLAIGSMCSIGAVGGTYQNLKLYMTLDLFKGMEAQSAQSTAATVLSIILFSSVVGRLLMGFLADRFPKKRVMLLIYLIVALSIPLLFIAGTPGVIYIFAALFGLGLGGDYMIIPLMAAELFGVKVMGRVMGLVLTADGVAEALAPNLVAKLADKTGSYAAGFALLIALALAGAVAVALLPGRGARDTA